MRLLRPITGLVLAIDFRHNGKDAWYRTAGSLVGTLVGGASVSNGRLLCDSDDDFLRYAIGAAAQVPGQAGAVLVDCDPPAASVYNHVLFAAKPAAASLNNYLVLYRDTAENMRCIAFTSGAAATGITPTGLSGDVGRTNFAMAWEGFSGAAGTAEVHLSADGGTPSSYTGGTLTRTEADATGQIDIGNETANPTDHSFDGPVYRLAIFNITNPAGQDLTAVGWSADAIWDAIFPRTRLNGMST